MEAKPRRYDDQRESSSQRGYGYRWQKAREGYLRNHQLCVVCNDKGRIVAASVVDHITPHKGDMVLFWDSSNWQSLCKGCHDSYKTRLELSGRIDGCTADGIPTDPRHHWNATSRLNVGRG
jgi:5-methylcytosine-specific restriction endonuclease McrA